MKDDSAKNQQKKQSGLELYYLTLAYQQGKFDFSIWRKRAKEWALSIIKSEDK